ARSRSRSGVWRWPRAAVPRPLGLHGTRKGMRFALASLAFSTGIAACANAPQREEAAPPLVVPPLAEAGAAPAAGEEGRSPPVPSPLAVPARDPRPAM